MSREVVVCLYCHNYLISLIRLDRQRKLLMRTDVKRREIWEWSDHTPTGFLEIEVPVEAGGDDKERHLQLKALRGDRMNRLW